jgi:hypothetical protein
MASTGRCASRATLFRYVAAAGNNDRTAFLRGHFMPHAIGGSGNVTARGCHRRCHIRDTCIPFGIGRPEPIVDVLLVRQRIAMQCSYRRSGQQQDRQ